MGLSQSPSAVTTLSNQSEFNTVELLDEIVSEFLVESYESLDQLDRDLMALEESPGDRERMSSIFRTIHTIKGTSGFLAFPKLEKVTHVGESLLVPLRDGELTLSVEIANNLLAMVDAVRSILRSIEAGTGEGDNEYAELIKNLERLRTEEPAAVAPSTAEIEVNEVIEQLAPAPEVVSVPTNTAKALQRSKANRQQRKKRLENVPPQLQKRSPLHEPANRPQKSPPQKQKTSPPLQQQQQPKNRKRPRNLSSRLESQQIGHRTKARRQTAALLRIPVFGSTCSYWTS